MSDEEAIRELQQRWLAATMNGDDAAVAELMTDDVVFLVPGRPPFGRQEFLQQFRLMKNPVRMICEGHAEEILVTGGIAQARTRLEITITAESGDLTRQLSGYTLSIFRKTADGQWKLFRDANLLGPKPLPAS